MLAAETASVTKATCVDWFPAFSSDCRRMGIISEPCNIVSPEKAIQNDIYVRITKRAESGRLMGF